MLNLDQLLIKEHHNPILIEKKRFNKIIVKNIKKMNPQIKLRQLYVFTHVYRKWGEILMEHIVNGQILYVRHETLIR